MTTFKLINKFVAEAKDEPELLDSPSIDVAVFSPPYFRRDGYDSELMRDVGIMLGRSLKPGARAFMVFGPTKEGLSRPWEAANLILDAGKPYGIECAQTIIWVKSIAIDGVTRGHFQPINSTNLVNYCHEPVFQFVKDEDDLPLENCYEPVFQFTQGDGAPLDRLSIGVPYQDKTNLKRCDRGKNGDVHCRGDVWFIPYETTGHSKKKSHRHAFPEKLAEMCIKLSGVKPGGTVLDMFCGSGTTAVASKKLGLNFVGVECDPDTAKTASEAWLSTPCYSSQ